MKGVLNVAMENIEKYGSKEIVVAAIKIALTSDRREEKLLQQEMSKYGISTAQLIMAEIYQFRYENCRKSCSFFKKRRSYRQ